MIKKKRRKKIDETCYEQVLVIGKFDYHSNSKRDTNYFRHTGSQWTFMDDLSCEENGVCNKMVIRQTLDRHIRVSVFIFYYPLGHVRQHLNSHEDRKKNEIHTEIII